MELDECFLCSDATPPLHRFCGCRMVAHLECMRHTIETVRSHRVACPVCTVPYRTESRRVWNVFFKCHHVIFVDCVVLGFGALEVLLIQHSLGENTTHYVAVIAILLVFLMSTLAWSIDLRCRLLPIYGPFVPLCIKVHEEVHLLHAVCGEETKDEVVVV